MPSAVTDRPNSEESDPFETHTEAEADLMPSAVTDRPNPEESDTSDSEQNISMPFSLEQQEPQSTSEQQSTSKQLSKPEQHLPSTSKQGGTQKTPSNFISPEAFRGFPKAEPRKPSNMGKKRGKTMIATSTPELKRIKNTKIERDGKTKAVKAKKSLFDESSSDSDTLGVFKGVVQIRQLFGNM